MSTFDHVAITCVASVFDAEIKFLNTALAPIGIKEQLRPMPLLSGLGHDGQRPTFFISGMAKGQPNEEPVTRSHIAFSAPSRKEVDEFHRIAVAAGGQDYGAPGLRDHFGPGYYAAFIISPGGHNIEVIFRDPELGGK